ncbi:hypothetical protein ACFRNJ_12330 [Streptomyces sp. NPDC056721]|uniref:hypothetical protein n=1 Tax=Streptomyces sp. NPDC056721 TaxID=3345923 RepID=UPI0036A03E39
MTKLSRPQRLAIVTTLGTDGAQVDARPNTLASLVRLGLAEYRTRRGGLTGRAIQYAVLTAEGQQVRAELSAPVAEPTAEEEPAREDLTGHYEPNVPGARTLRDARPLYLNGKHVTVNIDGDRLYLYVGGTWLYSGAIPAEIKTRADVNPWAARTALADPAPWAQVGARIGTPMGPGTVTGRDIWEDGTYVIVHSQDRREGDDWVITASSEHLRRLCALCDTVGDSDDDPEYPARFTAYGAYLCGFCAHAYLDRYIPHTLPGRPEDGWGIFDRENVWFTTICMTEEQAKTRAEELNYRTPAAFDRPAPAPERQDAAKDGRASLSGLPLPVVTVAEVLELLAPVPFVDEPYRHYLTHRRVSVPVTPRTPLGIGVEKTEHATLAEALEAAKEEAARTGALASVFCDAVTIGRTDIARVSPAGEVTYVNDYANPDRLHLVDQH